MRKSRFNNFLLIMKERAKHIANRHHFVKLVPNPAGTKMANRCKPESKRGADGTLRR